MKVSLLITAPFKFWRHLNYHPDIIKPLRWAKADVRRYTFYSALTCGRKL